MKLPQDKKIPVKLDFELSLFSLVRRLVGIAVIVILAILYFNKRNELQEQLTLNEAVNAKLETWVDKDGLNRAKIQALETSNTKTFLALQTRDSSIIQLQKDVKSMNRYLKKQGSVTNFSTQTDIVTSGETEVIPNDIEPEYPIYKSQFNLIDKNNKSWVLGESIASKDSTFIDLDIINEYSLTIGREPQGFLGLGKSKSFADVKNLNPYSRTTSLRTYQVTLPRPKRFGIGPVVAYGVGENGFGWFAGVGGTWSLIQF